MIARRYTTVLRLQEPARVQKYPTEPGPRHACVRLYPNIRFDKYMQTHILPLTRTARVSATCNFAYVLQPQMKLSRDGHTAGREYVIPKVDPVHAYIFACIHMRMHIRVICACMRIYCLPTYLCHRMLLWRVRVRVSQCRRTSVCEVGERDAKTSRTGGHFEEPGSVTRA